MEKLSLLDFKLPLMSMEYKREFFYKLDLSLKQIHIAGGYVNNFNPDSIFVDEVTKTPSFTAIFPLDQPYSNSDDIKKANLLWLADLAFCCYLPDYDLKQGLLNPEVVSVRFEDFQEYVPAEDVEYYRSIFTMNYGDPTISPSYYSDYIQKQLEDVAKHQSSGISYVKSTPIGRAMSTKDKEAAYIHYLFIICVVLSFIVFSLFILINILPVFS
ncbi:MAG: hypothetical protein PUB18_03590 [bacterium]|nr:hypothetical protein [bacterium]